MGAITSLVCVAARSRSGCAAMGVCGVTTFRTSNGCAAHCGAYVMVAPQAGAHAGSGRAVAAGQPRWRMRGPAALGGTDIVVCVAAPRAPATLRSPPPRPAAVPWRTTVV